jgi:excisionase family DNA binding protein
VAREVIRCGTKLTVRSRFFSGLQEVAQLLGIARSTVYALIAAGELPVVRIGRVTRVSRHALEGWVEARTQRWAS